MTINLGKSHLLESSVLDCNTTRWPGTVHRKTNNTVGTKITRVCSLRTSSSLEYIKFYTIDFSSNELWLRMKITRPNIELFWNSELNPTSSKEKRKIFFIMTTNSNYLYLLNCKICICSYSFFKTMEQIERILNRNRSFQLMHSGRQYFGGHKWSFQRQQ